MRDSLNAKIFDYFAREDAAKEWWSISFETGGRYGKQMKFLQKHINGRNENVLDVATGPGRFAIHFAKTGADRIVALDISPKMIEIAKRNADLYGVTNQIEFITNNIFNIDYPEQSFDIIILMEVLVHLPRPSEVITKLSRLLKRNGCLALNFDFPYAPAITYPINFIHSVKTTLRRGLRTGNFKKDVIMFDTIEETIEYLDSTKQESRKMVMRPRDAYQGIKSKLVLGWLGRSGLQVVASVRERTRLFEIPIPISIGMMYIARKV